MGLQSMPRSPAAKLTRGGEKSSVPKRMCMKFCCRRLARAFRAASLPVWPSPVGVEKCGPPHTTVAKGAALCNTPITLGFIVMGGLAAAACQ